MAMDSTPVRRCVCADVSFKTLRDAGVRSVEEASARFGVGITCGNCRPYIARMLATGETAFAVWTDIEAYRRR